MENQHPFGYYSVLAPVGAECDDSDDDEIMRSIRSDDHVPDDEELAANILARRDYVRKFLATPAEPATEPADWTCRTCQLDLPTGPAEPAETTDMCTDMCIEADEADEDDEEDEDDEYNEAEDDEVARLEAIQKLDPIGLMECLTKAFKANSTSLSVTDMEDVLDGDRDSMRTFLADFDIDPRRPASKRLRKFAVSESEEGGFVSVYCAAGRKLLGKWADRVQYNEDRTGSKKGSPVKFFLRGEGPHGPMQPIQVTYNALMFGMVINNETLHGFADLVRDNVKAAFNMVVGYIGMHGKLKVLLRNLQHFVSAQHGVFRRQADAGRYPTAVVITAAKTMFQVRPIV